MVTGVAGFIGMHVGLALLARGHAVAGIDWLQAADHAELQRARLARLASQARFDFQRVDVADSTRVPALLSRGGFDAVVHLAAQAGVRRSFEQPREFAHSNVAGFVNLLEACRLARVPHVLYASSSSVYGLEAELPFTEDAASQRPASLYAATKMADELIAHSYAHVHRLPCTGLRFFTVYGPWGRPDMAYWRFTRAMLAGEPIELYGGGRARRDFTEITDAVRCTLALIERPPAASGSAAPCRVLNIGRGQPRTLDDLVGALARHLDCQPLLRQAPLPRGDVPATEADLSRLRQLIGEQALPQVGLDEGIGRFVRWYRTFHRAELGSSTPAPRSMPQGRPTIASQAPR